MWPLPSGAKMGAQKGGRREFLETPSAAPPLTSRRVLAPTGPGHQERPFGPLVVLIFPFIQQPFCC